MSAAFKATEGNGGSPVVVSREPVEAPKILRGEIWIEGAGGIVGVDRLSDDADTVTFTRRVGNYAVTYHDVQVIGSSPTLGLQSFVGPHDVVTWEKISVAP